MFYVSWKETTIEKIMCQVRGFEYLKPCRGTICESFLSGVQTVRSSWKGPISFQSAFFWHWNIYQKIDPRDLSIHGAYMGIAQHLFHLSTLARKHGRIWIGSGLGFCGFFFWKHAPKGGFWYRQTRTPWETLF